MADNCDCEDNADNSPYPKGKGPAFPDHPNCMCSMEPNYADDKPDTEPKDGVEWVDHPALLPEQFM